MDAYEKKLRDEIAREKAVADGFYQSCLEHQRRAHALDAAGDQARANGDTSLEQTARTDAETQRHEGEIDWYEATHEYDTMAGKYLALWMYLDHLKESTGGH